MTKLRVRRMIAAISLLGGALIASVAGAPPASAALGVVTFDGLANNFAAVTTHTEAGMTINFTNGGDHFHTVTGSPGTGARFFGSDGWPSVWSTGGPFNLLSIDVLSYSGTVTFTATPGGGTKTITSTGTVNFPATFQNITSVTLTLGSNTDFDVISLDNIRFGTDLLVDACEPGSPVPAGYNLIEGTSGSDTLSGTSGKDLIRGLDGDDTIRAYSSNDIVCGNDGNDTLYGGSGNDTLVGGTGTDTLNGESGTDRGVDPDGDTTRISIESNV